jgi:hypothetical protein
MNLAVSGTVGRNGRHRRQDPTAIEPCVKVRRTDARLYPIHAPRPRASWPTRPPTATPSGHGSSTR